VKHKLRVRSSCNRFLISFSREFVLLDGDHLAVRFVQNQRFVIDFLRLSVDPFGTVEIDTKH